MRFGYRLTQLQLYLANSCDKLGLLSLHAASSNVQHSAASGSIVTVCEPSGPLGGSRCLLLLKWSREMRHLPESEHPLFVSDRLAAVSHVPTQFLVSVGIAVVILFAAPLADTVPSSDGAAGLVDLQETASVSSTAATLTIDDRDSHAAVEPCVLMQPVNR
jgi:hypothetical protein